MPQHVAAPASETTAVPVTLAGIIDSDNHDTLAFTPDGNTVFFDGHTLYVTGQSGIRQISLDLWLQAHLHKGAERQDLPKRKNGICKKSDDALTREWDLRETCINSERDQIDHL